MKRPAKCYFCRAFLYSILMRILKKLFEFLVQPRQLYFYVLLAIIVPNVFLCFTEHYGVGAIFCNLLVPLSIYSYLLTLRRRPGLMTWVLFPFIFISAFQLVLLYLFGNSIIAVDMFLNLVTTNANEALELLDNLVPAVVGVFVLYIPALVLAVISMKRKGVLTESLTRKLRKNALWGMLVSAVALGVTCMTDKDYEIQSDVFPINVCYNCYLAFERTEDVARYAETSKDFCFEVQPEHDAELPEIYLFVIGETGRACNWGLYGYERNTTPKLQQQMGVVCFTDALTQSNTTHKSVPMLMSLASAENYDRIYHEKSVITAFKEAGFYTAYFSNQKYNHAFIDLFGKEADKTVFLKEEGKSNQNTNDLALTELVDQLLSEGHRKLFIVLHTYGSHFNYKERYPAEAAVFTPDNASEASPKNRLSLINAYDNTIHQTDAFLSGLIDLLKEQNVPAVMVYTSDHGEDIFDDDRCLFLHSSPVPSYYQLHVPFLIWMSELYAECYPEVRNGVMENRNAPLSSNAVVVPTLLEMAGFNTPYRIDSLSLANSDFHMGTRFFISDHNEPEGFDEVGLDEEDFNCFREKHIAGF